MNIVLMGGQIRAGAAISLANDYIDSGIAIINYIIFCCSILLRTSL